MKDNDILAARLGQKGHSKENTGISKTVYPWYILEKFDCGLIFLINKKHFLLICGYILDLVLIFE